MPLKISDSKLSSLYKSLETKRATNPNVKISGETALQLLAAIGDKGSSNFDKILKELKKAGMTREKQIALVKTGMTATEKKDLTAILDKGSVPLDDDTKKFFEAVLDRGTTPTPVPTSGLAITGNQANGLSGTSKPGASIEAINISAAPEGRLHMDDTMVIGKADASGKFSAAKLTGDQKIREGDLIRMRARYADGSTSDWVTVKASGVESSDSRNAAVALFRIGVTDAGGGKVSVANINESRQVSEPGAKLQFTNARTGEKTQVTITETGGFPAGFQLKGKAGDSFSVAASDGTNNTNFSVSVGNVTVPGAGGGDGDLIPDPALHKDELRPDGTPNFSKTRFTGPLFSDGVRAEDVAQGQLGNCYFPAAMAAVAKANPEAISKLIKDNGDGTYTVNFKQKDYRTNRYVDVPVKVDGDLYVRSYGGALYGRSMNSSDPKKMELWYPLVEKAYAQWKGSYDKIGNGGVASDVMEAVLGREGDTVWNSSSNKDSVFSTIKRAVDAKLPVAAGTSHDESIYTNTGVYGDHAYSIMGYEETGGQKYVVLRNPWGESEPAGNGANDGIFKLKLEEYVKLYQTTYYVN